MFDWLAKTPFWRDEETDRELVQSMENLADYAENIDPEAANVDVIQQSCYDKIDRLRNELQLRRER